MIKMFDVSAGYNNEVIIKNIQMAFEAGTVTSIIGKNGCGKTTLLKTAANILRPYNGQVMIDDDGNWINVHALKNKEIATRISYMPQHKETPNISVSGLVMHGRFPYLNFSRIPQKKDREIVEKALEITGTIDLRHKNLQELSGGQRQKVYLAMVLAQDTEILFLDEPTTYLDIDHQFEILHLIDTLKKMGKTIVMVIHDISNALKYSDKVCLMDKGEIISCDTPKEIIKSKHIDKIFNICCEEIWVDSTKTNQYIISLKEKI